jgi:hypothetical protein
MMSILHRLLALMVPSDSLEFFDPVTRRYVLGTIPVERLGMQHYGALHIRG